VEGMEVAPIPLSQLYGWFDLRVSIDDVEDPDNTIRSTAHGRARVEEFIASGRNDLYGESGDFISITMYGLAGGDLTTFVEKLRFVSFASKMSFWTYLEQNFPVFHATIAGKRVVFVDGRHRGEALRDPEVRKTPSGEFPGARFWYRLDGLPMSALDVQRIGGNLNDSGEKRTLMSTLDRITSALSFIKNSRLCKEVTADIQSEKLVQFWERFITCEPAEINRIEMYHLCKVHNINSSSNPIYLHRFNIAAIGIYIMCGPDEGRQEKEKAIIDLIRPRVDPRVSGADALWETKDKTITAQKWLLSHTYQCLDLYLKPKRTSSSTRKKRSTTPVNSINPIIAETIPSTLWRVWKSVVGLGAESKIEEDSLLSVPVKTESDGATTVDMDEYLTEWIKKQGVVNWSTKKSADFDRMIDSLAADLRILTEAFETYSAKQKADMVIAQDVRSQEGTKSLIQTSSQPSNSGNATSLGDGGTGASTTKGGTGTTGRTRKGKGRKGRDDDAQVSPDDYDSADLVDDEDNEGGGDSSTALDDQGRPLRRSKRKRTSKSKILDDADPDDDVPASKRVKETTSGTSTKNNDQYKTPTVPPGTRGLAGEPNVRGEGHPQCRVPFWRKPLKEEDKYWKKPENRAQQPATGPPRLLKDENGFEIEFERRDGDRYDMSYTLPEPNIDGFVRVFPEVDEDVTVGEYRSMFGTGMPLGGLYYRSDKQPVARVFEDYMTNRVSLRSPFVMDRPLKYNDAEYDVVRTPPTRVRQHLGGVTAQRLLKAMGFRMPHRAMLHLNLEDIVRVRRCLGANILRPHRTAVEVAETLASGGEKAANLADKVYKDKFKELFSKYRSNLDKNGFTVFNDILHRDMSSTKEDKVHGFDDVLYGAELGTNLDQYTSYFEKMLPSEGALQDGDFSEDLLDIFSSIREEEAFAPDADLLHVDSRITTRTQAVTEMFEEMEDKDKGLVLSKQKAELEVAIMQLSQWLHLEDTSFDATDIEQGTPDTEVRRIKKKRRKNVPLYCPDTGSRVLMNASKYGTNQIAHVDYMFKDGTPLASDDSVLHPPYFAVATTADPTPLWILEKSHTFAGRDASSRAKLAPLHELRLIFIPPWSIFICRGDVIHAGASGEIASRLSDNPHCVRVHLYIGRRQIGLPDSINDYHAKGFHIRLSDAAITDKTVLRSLIRTDD